MIKSEYLYEPLNTAYRLKTIRNIVKYLKPLKKEKYAIAFCGMSGSLVAPDVASRLNKPLWIVRKSGTPCHSYSIVEGDRELSRYVIIDDFIQSGNSLKYITDAIKNFNGVALCAKAILYRHPRIHMDGWQEKFNFPLISREECNVQNLSVYSGH